MTQLPDTKCLGCDEVADLFEGQIVPRFMPGEIKTVYFCRECWDIVDNADPVTGAFGAACCDVKRWVSSIDPTGDILRREAARTA